MRTTSRYAVTFANVGHLYTHLFMLLFPTVVLALEREWAMPYGDLLTLALPGSILFGLGALPAGWLGDRWSAPAMMAIFFLGLGGAALLTSAASTPLQIALGLSAVGLFASIYHPVGMAMLVNNAEKKGKALGMNGVFGSTGTACAALVAGALIDGMSWRAAFYVPGVVALLTGLGFLLSLHRTDAPLRGGRDGSATEGHNAGFSVRRLMAVLTVTMICSGLIYQATSIALPKLFAVRLSSFSSGGVLGVGTMVTLVYLVGGAAQLVGGHLADKWPAKAVYLMSFALQLPVLLLAGAVDNSLLIAAAVGMVFFNVVGLPVENGLIAQYTPPQWRATAYGAKFVIAIGIAALAVPLVGQIYDRTSSFLLLFLVLGGMAALAVAVVAFFLPGATMHTPSAPAATGSPAAAGAD